MNKKIASEISVEIILLVALIIGGIIWLGNKNDNQPFIPISKKSNTKNIPQSASVEKNTNDFSYSIEKYGANEKTFFNVASAGTCINFEANSVSGECKKYTYKYARTDNNLRIILTDLSDCSWNLTSYGIKGKICNLEKGKYSITLKRDDSEANILEENTEIK